MAKPLLWTSLPTALPAIGQIGERSVVYYCGDDFGALAGVDHAPVLEMEDKLIKKASLIIAASEVLAGRFPKHKTLHVPHGVDMSLFSMPAPRAATLHRERPTAGFYGSLSDWIDVELLAAAAVAMPDWDFALIGPVQTDISRLRRLANVNVIGPIDHALLPTFSQHWTASMLPFRDCEQIRACNPLKLREYLAAGRPIVTTDFPALSPYRDLVSVARNVDQFIAALRASPTAADSRVAQRRAKVACETWDARAEVIDQALRQL